MLQAIKERAQGWVAWAIVILISIPFALWGIQSYLGVGAEPVVATVDGAKITERQLDQNVQRSRMQLRERLGAAYNPDLFESAQLRGQVLDRMIRDLVLLESSYAMGLRVSDAAVRAAILAEPAFQGDGVFDKDTYERVLRLQGFTPAAYEEELRRGLLSTQLARALTESAFATAAEVTLATRLLRQQRDIAYALVPRAGFMPEADPPADDIQAFYEANPERFQSPARVKLSYILLDADAIAAVEVDEATLRETYEARLEEFVEPERRAMRHILLTVPADGDAETIKARAAELKAQIDAGADFAEVAQAESEDPGSAAQGGDLGMVDRGIMDPAFEQAAFDLDVNAVSEPVRSRFGYHLIEVTAVEGGAAKPFDDVREELARELGRGDAEAAYFELAEQLANLTYESPDSLIPAAEALALEVRTSDWIERDGGEGLFAQPRLMTAAFSDDVLVVGNNSELIEPDPDRMQAVVLRVDEHEPASVRPLDEVRDEIVAALKAQQAATAARAEADAMVARLRAGESLDAVAAELEIKSPGEVSRSQADVPPTVLELAFSAPRPAEDGVPSYASGAEPGGDAVIVAVRAVADGSAEAMDPAMRDAERRLLAQIQGEHGFNAVLDDLVARAKVERKPLTVGSEETP
ncbi:SurA N-terminal domain-containing protein [Thiohalocapsa sp. ML1]|uniref:SurA N-terminal domain-containing protein n=1 Tax=Thiohalocapsa sp. ML1 TaxID=1431688 RepID=UPI0007322D5E|nr:SurA N-terminal domain-containing protein [Thiohalocapsa sp. ML1]